MHPHFTQSRRSVWSRSIENLRLLPVLATAVFSLCAASCATLNRGSQSDNTARHSASSCADNEMRLCEVTQLTPTQDDVLAVLGVTCWKFRVVIPSGRRTVVNLVQSEKDRQGRFRRRTIVEGPSLAIPSLGVKMSESEQQPPSTVAVEVLVALQYSTQQIPQFSIALCRYARSTLRPVPVPNLMSSHSYLTFSGKEVPIISGEPVLMASPSQSGPYPALPRTERDVKAYVSLDVRAHKVQSLR